MKLFKAAGLAALALVTATCLAGCQPQSTPYNENDREGYTVSVKYDANGGTTQSGSVVLTDSFNVADMSANGGEVSIALLPPEHDTRGNDKFILTKENHFLAGWYRERIETTDADGNVSYTYSDKWDFEDDRLKLAADGDYSAAEPVMTLYAAWVPLFRYDFYTLGSDEQVGSYVFDPTASNELVIPQWDEETGAMKMYNVPAKKGYTFEAAYLDADGKQAVTTDTVTHHGVLDAENGTAKDTVMNLYVDWTEGEWYRITSAEQFKENASLSGCYDLGADLDFTDVIWPTSLMYGNFSGQIRGNGHTIKNVTIAQTNNSKTNAGLFGNLTETAVISDVTLQNIRFTVEKGTRVKDTSFGLFAGRIMQDAVIEKVKILDSVLEIDSSAYFGVEEYSIGLVCGTGDATVVPNAEITCQATGDNAAELKIKVDGNTVTLGD